MAEKSFRQIETEIAEKGFSELCKEAASEIQNITRMLGYMRDANPVCKNVTDMICAHLMRSGAVLMTLAQIEWKN